MTDEWTKETRLHRGNHATIRVPLSRELKVHLSIAGDFNRDELAEIVGAIRNVAQIEGRPLFTEEEIDHLRRIRRYFNEVAGTRLENPDVRDARRYRRLRVLGVAVNEKQLREGTVSTFTNLDALVDNDIKFQHRGEAREDPLLGVDWNSDAKAVLDKVLMLFAQGKH